MSGDVVALCARHPEPGAMLAALRAAGPDLRVDVREDGGLIQLYDERELLVSVEAPRLVQVPGEVERLLGIPGPVETPLWWVEARVPALGRGISTVHRLVAALVSVTGGTTWQSR